MKYAVLAIDTIDIRSIFDVPHAPLTLIRAVIGRFCSEAVSRLSTLSAVISSIDSRNTKKVEVCRIENGNSRFPFSRKNSPGMGMDIV